MKKTILLLALLLSSCSFSSSSSSLINNNPKETSYLNIYKNTTVIFLGPNISDGAQYLIYISCTDLNPYISSIQSIPKDKSIRIDLSPDCKSNRIPSITLDTVTDTNFYYVSFISGFSSGLLPGEYQFNDEEVKKIGMSPWKYQVLDGFSKEQYKIIRNTKNPIREAFEPTGTSQFYTEKEQEECGKYFKDVEGTENMNLLNISIDKTLNCYRNLPPLP